MSSDCNVADRVRDCVDRLIGAPYAPHGRGPAYDCLGVTLYLLKELCDVPVADPLEFQLRGALEWWRSAFFAVRGTPESGDIARYESPSGPHFAFLLDCETAVESTPETGVRRIPVADLRARGAEFFRYGCP